MLDSDWGKVQPGAAGQNAFLESHSWEEYAQWHLGLTEGASDHTKANRPAVRRLRSWTLQEPQIDRRKYQNNSDVNDQPSPEVVPEEQDVHADHDGYHREHVKRDGHPVSHRFILVSTRPPRLTCRRPLI